MQNLYKQIEQLKPWQYILAGFWLWILTIGGAWAQVPGCGPNQVLVGYVTGAKTVVSSNIDASNIIGIPDGLTATLASSSTVTLDMGTILSAGNVLSVTYRSIDTDAPLQVLVSTTGAANSFTNVAQLPGSYASTTGSLTLPLDTRYVRLQTTGTTYMVDAVTYPIYRCAANPIPVCSTGQTLLSYPTGALTVAGTTGTVNTRVTNSINATGLPDGATATLDAFTTMTLDLGNVVAAGNTLNLTYSTFYDATYSIPVQVWVSTTGTPGSFTLVGSAPPSSTDRAVMNQSLSLPYDARYVQFVNAGERSVYYIDALTYSLYFCVTLPSTACQAGKQSVSYNTGAVAVTSSGSTGSGSVTNASNAQGVPDGAIAAMTANSFLVMDMGSTVAAGNTLTFTYSSGASSTPLQVWSSTSANGTYTYIGSLSPNTVSTTGQITLPIDSRYIRLTTSAINYNIDAITVPVINCVTIPNTACSTGQKNLTTQNGTVTLNGQSSAGVTNNNNLLGLSDGISTGLAANSWIKVGFSGLVSAGNQINIYYSSSGNTAPLQVLVATSAGGAYTNIAQLPGNTSRTVASLVLPVDAQYVYLLTTGQDYSVDAITQTVYNCVANPAVCAAGQQAVSYPVGTSSVNSFTGATSSNNATGVPDGTYALLGSTNTLILDFGSIINVGNELSFTYYSSQGASTALPLQVLVATTPGGSYTAIGTLEGDQSAKMIDIPLPVNARYVKLISPAQNSATFYLDAVTYKGYQCISPPSVTCATGQIQMSYQAGAQSYGSASGVTSPANAVGPIDQVTAAMPANTALELNMGSLIPAGTELSVNYSSDNSAATLQVLVSTTQGGSYSYVGSLNPSTALTKNSLILPFVAQYVLLKTGGTNYSIDGVTYPVYTCVKQPGLSCGSGKTLVTYDAGAKVTGNTSGGTVANTSNSLGVPDGSLATIPPGTTFTLDMGAVIPGGTPLLFTYGSQYTTPNVVMPMQVAVSTSSTSSFTNIGSLQSTTIVAGSTIKLPIDARYIQVTTFSNTNSTYYLDAISYPIYACITPVSTTCASGNILTDYTTGLQAVGNKISGTVTAASNALGTPDGVNTTFGTNTSQIYDFGNVVTAGNEINITYNSTNVTSPLLLQVSTDGSTFTNVAALPGTTTARTINFMLPLDARYVLLKTVATQYFVDALTYSIYKCVPSPVVSCTGNQVLSSYLVGAVQPITNSASVTNPANITGVPNGGLVTMAANGTLVADMGTMIPAGTPLYINYASSNVAAPLQVLVSNSATGSYTAIAQLPGSTAAITVPITLPFGIQYIKLVTTSTTYNVDAVTYPIYTCVAPISSTCGSGQQSVSYQAPILNVIGQSSSGVSNVNNLTDLPDAAYATLAANSYVTLQLSSSAVQAGNSLRVTYVSSSTAAALMVQIATSLGGPYTDIAQLPGSTTRTTQTVNLPLNAQYVKLLTGTQAYSVDAVTYPLYTCVNNPANSCAVGQQVVSYAVGAVSPSGLVSGVTNPANAAGSPDGAYAIIAANATTPFTVDLGSIVAGGNTLTFTYKSSDLVAPLQVLVSSTAGGPYTNIAQLPASTVAANRTISLPVDARYVQLQTDATAYSVDAVTHPVYNCVSSNTTSGIVYLDGNINGILNSTEQGLGGVTVKAYDASGNLVGTTTTSYANPTLNIPAGYYSFGNLTAGQPYRLEFTNWPSYYNPSVYGIDNGTTVQFIQGASQNNDFGLYNPSIVCSFLPNPRMVTGKGLITGTTSVDSYNYYDRGLDYYNATTQTMDIGYAQVGVPLGLDSQRPNNLVYMSPISTNMPSVFPMAPDGSSAIYIANYNGPNGTQSYQGAKLLVKLSDLGINVGNPSTTVGGNPFGVQGLGGLTFSVSGDTLYVVNMSNGNLVQVDVSNVDYNNLPATAPTTASEITPPASLANCSGGVYRPTALKQYGGKIYMGGVCDAEISGSNADLKGVVLAYDPTTATWSKVLSYPIDFTTGELYANGYSQVGWASTSSGKVQPVLLDLAFGDNGQMVIGTTDRLVYNAATSNRQKGYIMGAWPNGDGTYTLENGGKLGPYTSQVTSQNTGSDGPGGKWFFQQSTLTSQHNYTYEGGLYIKAGTNELVGGFSDPSDVSSYGAAYLNLSSGVANYFTILGWGQKLTRITGTDQICDAVPPIEIGNRVWKDTNNNGIQDAGEPSLAGVTVELRDANGNLVATAVTDANGNYIFSNQPGVNDTPSQKYNLPITQLTDYTIRVSSLGTDPSTTGLTLTGITIAPGETAGATNTGATTTNNDAFLVNGLPTIKLTTGVDGAVNHNYDFGFVGSIFDLALTKKLATGQASVIKPGSQVTFTVTVKNQGTQPAYNIQVTDYVPAGLTLNDANWNQSGSLATLKTPISGSLAIGDSVKVNITFTVSSTVSGPIINKAEISSADNDTNPNNTPPTDVDSTPDQNPTNDAGGTPNSGSDDSVNGNGTGTPGDTNPATDEDDEDPAIIYVQPCTLGANLLTTEAHCGQSDGRATVTVNTGVAPYTYAWSTGASTSVITGLSGGQNFTVTVTDANGCQDVLVGSIQSTGGPSLTATATAASCQQATGSATVTASGGSGTYTYLWSNGATTASISNVASGTYTVKVTDGAGCVSSVAVIVPSTSPISAVATPTSASCLGANGSVTLTITGGTGPYSYVWDNGATTQNLTGVAGGTYKVKVTDANGCTAVATAVVANPGAPSVSGTVVNPLCFGTTTGSISVQASGGSGTYSYQWDNGATTASLTAIQAGIYNVVVTDGLGCRSGASFTLVAPSRIVADIQSLSAVCNAQGGVTGGTVQVVSVVGGTPGYSYLWSNGSAATSLSGLAAGTYSLTVTDSKGCLALGQAVVDPWPTCAKASLGDYVWFDTNKNGQQDPTETGVASVTAVLYNAATNQPISTTVTDANGKYLFTNLDPGSYYVKFTAPSGMTFTTANVGNDATDSDAGVGGQTGVYSLTVGEQNLTVDAGLIPLPASLGDYVWFDTNQNGQQDPTETGVASVTAVLYDAVSGTVVSTTVTDANGKYLFTNLDPGSYYVKFTAPSGTTFTSANVGNDATDSDVASLTGQSGTTGVYSLTAGEQNLTVDAGLVPLKASLGDYVWFDTNQNGQQDPTETGVASVTAVLYDAVSGTVVSTTVTDANGKYLFTNLDPGSYYVKFTAPSGTTFTSANVGNDATDSDVASLTGQSGTTGVYSLTAGEQNLTVDAGLVPLKAALGDYVWYDNNKNGQQDANEPPAVGVTVTLYNATTNQPISTTVTDATGHYLFPNLDPGTYYVVFTAPSGATFTTPNTGNDATDSDAGVGGRTGNYTLVAGQVDLTVDAGLIPQCTSPNCGTITVKQKAP
ncbi:MAG: carboxypeptidase regulatory-like domain-containing protein [Spirosoma sp.]|uniref:SdrD B-like domain-containing protein n=2 Tax=Spirosoma TaxID=107 RepID=UPI001ACF9B41|nr:MULTISPECIES: SdrD B-like domain-containing protein [unclassified Spirosoma]MBN8820717.1 carboxypeptidase regulatory-like domain-containing protein [Spirosoma sp.]